MSSGMWRRGKQDQGRREKGKHELGWAKRGSTEGKMRI